MACQEVHIGIAPILLCDGLRFFEPLAHEGIKLVQTRVFRVSRKD